VADRPRTGRFSGRIKRPPGNPDLGRGGTEGRDAGGVRGAAWPEDRIGRPRLGSGDRDVDADPGFDGPPPLVDPAVKEGAGPGGNRRGLTLAVALLALGGFAAIVAYAYNLGQSDQATALIPVVEPDSGPVKQKPVDPGGLDVPHTDKGVLNDEAASGEEGGLETLLPAPEQPVAPPATGSATPPLADADDAGPSLDLRPEGLDATNQTEDVLAETEEGEEAQLTEEILAQRVEELTRKLEALQAAAEQREEGTETAPETAPETATETATAQPTGADRSAPQPEPAPAPADPPAPAPGAEPLGDYRIQLAALRSEDAARSEWQRLVRRYPAILEDLDLVIVPVEVEDRGTFYRIQGGYFDEAGAEAACETLIGQGQACIVRQ